jgi:hypothetical protein
MLDKELTINCDAAASDRLAAFEMRSEERVSESPASSLVVASRCKPERKLGIRQLLCVAAGRSVLTRE